MCIPLHSPSSPTSYESFLFTYSNACSGSEVHIIMRYIACCSAIHPYNVDIRRSWDWVLLSKSISELQMYISLFLTFLMQKSSHLSKHDFDPSRI